MFSAVPASRLLLISHAVDEVLVLVQRTRQRLYVMEANCSHDFDLRARVTCQVRRYRDVGGFSACNFFTVNKSLVASIVGFMTTYIIVLVQFKQADKLN